MTIKNSYCKKHKKVRSLPARIVLFAFFIIVLIKPLSAQQPNVLFILADDLGWTDLGCFGSAFYETPNLDQLAADGMRFTDAYAAAPVCSPTRASIMSGKYPARLKNTDWFGAPQPDNVHKHWTRNKPLLPANYIEHLELSEKTIAEAFKENGYRTFFAGKWHLGHNEKFWPEFQGFDINKGGFGAGGPYGPGKYFTPYGNPRLEDGPEGEHLPDRLASETIEFIKQSDQQPFFAFLSFYSVHIPLVGRQDLIEKYREKAAQLNFHGDRWTVYGERKVRMVQDHPVYAAMVEAMDQAVGKVIQYLDQRGLSENTIVVFMSDNGGLSTSEGQPTSNYPLRAGKGWMYEGGIREPMIIKYPEIVQSWSESDAPVTSTDFYPTLLDLAGLPLQKQQHLDGMSLVPLLKQTGQLERDGIFWHYPHYGNQGGAPAAAIRQGNWKLIRFFEDNHHELYNLEKDISERYDLAEVQTEITKAMTAKLDRWLVEVQAEMPAPNPDSK